MLLNFLLTFFYLYSLVITLFTSLCFPIIIFPLPFKAEPLEVHLYWHHKAEHDPAMIWCKQQIENLLMG